MRPLFIGFFAFFLCTSLWHCGLAVDEEIAEAITAAPDQIDYNFHVKPILADRCFKCHGPDEKQRKGDLRLDLEEFAFALSQSDSRRANKIISAKSTAGSELAHRITDSEADYMMPPPESNLALNAGEKAILLKWIRQGGKYKEHWSFAAPVTPVIPDVDDESWIKTDIDRFILAQIKEKGLTPSESTEKETLLRRATLDLTGLPPSVDEIESFVSDDSPEAYNKVIDRLLESQHYGERMALEWLDVARYADSHGYQDDGMRNTWPWRDWVIEAFNNNMPFDTFLLWQLAGDLMPEPTQEMLLATCFNRNHPQTQEGGVVDEEYRVEYVADRTNTFGKALMGLTLECARCHDHKYDPISQQEYYQLYAYFNNNNDAGIVPYNGEAAPTIILSTDDARQKLDSLASQMRPLENMLVARSYQKEFEQWVGKSQASNHSVKVNEGGLLAHFTFDKEYDVPDQSIYLDKGPKPKQKSSKKTTTAYLNQAKGKLDAKTWGHQDDRAELVDGVAGSGVHFVGDAGIRFNRDLDFDRHQPFSLAMWIKVLKEGEEGPIFGKTNGDFEGYRGWLCKLNVDGTLSFQFNHVWPDNCIDFQTLEPIKVDEWMHISLTYDGSSSASGIRFYINGEIPSYKLWKDNLQKSILHGVKKSNWSNQPFLLGMELRKSVENVVMDELRIYKREVSALEILALSKQTISISSEITASADWREYYLLTGQNQRYNETLELLTSLRNEENLILTDQPEVMIMQEREQVRPTFILDRGMYDAPTDLVQPQLPTLFAMPSTEHRTDRLGLARWLIDPKHPLTHRVMVNRLWAMCFGKGLVATQEDFGSQGNLPSHPELLDWLAIRFVELDYDVKALLKEILLSATYQQSSDWSEKLHKLDPQSMLYARYPSHRLPAEIIRDLALSASNLLVPTIGGPSVYPYQPVGIWEALATRNATKYVQQHGDSLYRRSLYTVWKRSSPPPAMLNFDAPDRYYCVVRRQKTATPLQSLVLMNDPQFIEAARILAERILRSERNNLEGRLDMAYLLLIGRAPRMDERQVLVKQYLDEKQRLAENSDRIDKLLSIGEYPHDDSLDKAEIAAYTVVASTIMNYDEFVMKR
ncbi:MAG: DUF1553 domain-containing protein [Saprospiraceae bacterium]|nr:DUF1553 domain-containing protein [Saprospiraceae bacterium]